MGGGEDFLFSEGTSLRLAPNAVSCPSTLGACSASLSPRIIAIALLANISSDVTVSFSIIDGPGMHRAVEPVATLAPHSPSVARVATIALEGRLEGSVEESLVATDPRS